MMDMADHGNNSGHLEEALDFSMKRSTSPLQSPNRGIHIDRVGGQRPQLSPDQSHFSGVHRSAGVQRKFHSPPGSGEEDFDDHSVNMDHSPLPSSTLDSPHSMASASGSLSPHLAHLLSPSASQSAALAALAAASSLSALFNQSVGSGMPPMAAFDANSLLSPSVSALASYLSSAVSPPTFTGSTPSATQDTLPNTPTGLLPESSFFPSASVALSTLHRRRRANASGSSNEVGQDRAEPKKPKPVPDEKKDDTYWERRRKNNDAAKRSRDTRRQKEDEIAMRASMLEQENLRLRAELTVLKQQTSHLHLLLYDQASKIES